MRKQRRHFTPEQKASIIREHLLDKVPVSELCDKHGLQPTIFYRWQKELFEKRALVFERPSSARPESVLKLSAVSDTGSGSSYVSQEDALAVISILSADHTKISGATAFS